MPNYTGQPFIMMAILFFASFFLVFEWITLAAIGLVAAIVMMYVRSFDYDEGFHFEVDEIKEIEEDARGHKNE